MRCWIASTPTTDSEGTNPPSWNTYTYVSGDHSKKQIAVDDIVFLRDEKRLLAVARVESKSAEKHEHTVAKCPECGIAQIAVRKKSTKPYRCFYGHRFTTPVETLQVATRHTVEFVHNLVRIAAHIEAAELRPYELTNSRHITLRLVHIGGICAYVARRDHKVAPVLKAWLRRGSAELVDSDAAEPLTAQSMPLFDELERPHQSIRLRRGLASFRNKLIHRYGPQCMISGCSVLALLEACHVRRYLGPEDNHPANGILLRSDLHTLFDLDLIGLDPTSLEVTIDPTLIGTEYEVFAGTRLRVGGMNGVDMRAVRLRWEQFRNRSRPTALPTTPQFELLLRSIDRNNAVVGLSAAQGLVSSCPGSFEIDT